MSIQRDIISRLKNADTLRYSQLKPNQEIPNDLYNYHLKKLLSDGLVEKLDTGYRLSPQGKRHVADAHHTSDQSNRLFKFNALLVVKKNSTMSYMYSINDAHRNRHTVSLVYLAALSSSRSPCSRGQPVNLARKQVLREHFVILAQKGE